MKLALQQQTAIITGASQGLGLVIAQHFLQSGANVVFCGRTQKTVDQAADMLSQYCKNNRVMGLTADITQHEDCENIVSTCLREFHCIDILVNNAGIHGAKGPVDEVEWAAWESAIDVNLKGTVKMCRLVLPLMKKNKKGKIIILSGGGATKPMPFMSAYAASNTAIVRFSETLSEEVKAWNIDVNAVAPGAMNTQLLDDVLQAGPALIGEKKYQDALKQKESGGDDPNRAAKLCVYLASSESNGITGKLISAIWDPWENFSRYLTELKNSDVYTLRRIIPEERGLV